MDKLSPLSSIKDSKIKLIKSLDQWDKPLTGLADHDGKPVWFEFYKTNKNKNYYVLYEMDEQQLLDCEWWKSSDSKWSWGGPVFEFKNSIGWFVVENNQDFV